MSGFRSRFPTVTPWTTDQDLSDIVFRPCFISVVSEFVSPCPAGGARRPAARPGRCPPACRGLTPRPGGSGAGPRPWPHFSRCRRSQDMVRGPARPSPGRAAGRRTADRAPLTTTRRDHPLAFRTAHRARSAWRPGRRPTPPLISHIHPTGSRWGQGPVALHVTRHTRVSTQRLVTGVRAETAVRAGMAECGRRRGRRAVPLPSRSRNSRAGGLSRLRRRNTLWVSRLVSAYPARPSQRLLTSRFLKRR